MNIEQRQIVLTEYAHNGDVNKYDGTLTLGQYGRLKDSVPVVTDNPDIAHYIETEEDFEESSVTLITEGAEALQAEVDRLVKSVGWMVDIVVIRLK